MFRFANPWFLLAGLVIPAIIYYYRSGKGVTRVMFSSLEVVKRLNVPLSVKTRHSLIVLRVLALIFLVLAFARPQHGTVTTESITEGVEIMLCVDTSGSMAAMDFTLNGKRKTRLTVVKEVVKDFVNARKSDRIGMVVFGDEAFTQCPLTLDYGIVQSFLKKVEIRMASMEEDATAIGNALAMSVKRLKDVEAKSKIVVLLTDGVNNSGRITPTVAADIAKSMGVKVYTIGVGTGGEVPIQIDTPYGMRTVRGEIPLDEETLKMIADKTGGHYFRATDTKKLKEVYSKIDELEKTEIKVNEFTEYNELVRWFLLIALGLLMVEVILANTRFMKIP